MVNSLNAYEENLPLDLFLNKAFILLRKKVSLILDLSSEKQTKEIIAKRYEKTSEVLEALRLLESGLDYNNKDYKTLSKIYLTLQNSIFEGNHKDKSKLIESIAIIDSILKI